jgi:hypothetical protein
LVQEFRYRDGQLLGAVTRDELSCDRVTHCLRGAAGTTSYDGLSACLGFEQDHAESLDVLADLAVRENEQIGLLVASHELEVIGLAEKLHLPREPRLLYLLFQGLAFLAIASDSVQHIRDSLPDLGKSTDHHVVPLAFLEAANREDHRTVFPPQLAPNQSITRSRHESLGIDTWVQDLDPLRW